MTPRYLSPQAAARAESELLRAELDRTAARSKVLPASPPAVPPCSAPLQCPPGSAPISPWQCPGVLSYARIASRPPRMRAPRPSRRLQTRPLLTNPAPIVDRPRHRRRICAPPSSRYLFITPPRHRRRSAHLRARPGHRQGSAPSRRRRRRRSSCTTLTSALTLPLPLTTDPKP